MPQYSDNSRFRLDVVDADGNFVCSLPYRDMQGEWKLGADAEQLRFTVPYRDNTWITPDKLVPGKHWIFLMDRGNLVGTPVIKFGGPLLDVTASSADGTLNCSATSILFILKKRIVANLTGPSPGMAENVTYTSKKPTEIITDLLVRAGTWQRVFRAGFFTDVQQAGTATIPSYVTNGAELPTYFDLINDVCDKATEGLDYYVRWTGTSTTAVPTLRLYAGRIVPTTIKFGLEYGGGPGKGLLPLMQGYSLTRSIDTIGNYVVVTNTQEGFDPGVAEDASSRSSLGMDYQLGFPGVEELTTTTLLTDYATARVKEHPYGSVLPQIVVKGIEPGQDFTYGDQIRLYINDGWASYDDVCRVVGWQSTFGRQDQVTTVIYFNNLSEVS